MSAGTAVDSDARAKSMAVLRSFVATLSLMGSLCIVYIILSRKKLDKTYDRLLLGLSCNDAVVSLVFMFFFLMAPQDAGFDWAIGNTASCSAAGFFSQYGLSIGLYNSSLSMYYLLTIRYQKNEKLIAKRVEPFLHAVSILLPLTTGVVSATLGLFNPWPRGYGCWFEEYPTGCKGDECERGELAWLFAWIFAGIPVICMILFLTINYILIYSSVRRQERRNRRHSFQGRVSEESEKRRKSVATQATLYTIVFINTFFWPFLVEAVKIHGGSGGFGFAILCTTFYPSQGAFNFLIYVRPRYNTWRQHHPTKARFWALRQVVVSRENPQDMARQENRKRPPSDPSSDVESPEEQAGNYLRKPPLWPFLKATKRQGDSKDVPDETVGTSHENSVVDGDVNSNASRNSEAANANNLNNC